MSEWAFIIMAAGSGSRLGGTPKQFRSLGGRPMWEWSFDLARNLGIEEIVLVLPEDWDDRVYPVRTREGLSIIRGGRTRSLSVRNGIASVRSNKLLIHDGARPFAKISMCERIMSAVSRDTGAIPLLPARDALKKVSVDDVVKTMDRSDIRMTQTPQGFPREGLLKALSLSSEEARDEAEPWISNGGVIVPVEGDEMNFKVTTEGNWEMATCLADRNSAGEIRTGIGFDVHPLVPGRSLVLGGVPVSSPMGLEGHSDADLICHGISDAILGAAGLPDIGRLFPACDDAYRDADSYELLRKVVSKVEECGWSIVWLDVVLHAQLPRIGETVIDITRNLDSIWNDGVRRVNLKVKSGEGVGSVGSGHCMMCYAVATIKKHIHGVA
ncbi:2-C-methyl-D-erythritol 2,4-cyclodiphosphate synthase [Dethiosulfovibrio sp. F2B]|uniref:2-C-methyl-D-erythritol 2,4-cyclodiphosphate synthase n=1 Tax=Dethiosulfovibrio faecalis TaxID=2720018 RepID=UPI001F1A6365|nr:2-C-methyl-D-erythritol 2,4-cyclodiphosphate synthase [Dethiosulfovibrio faecalis]